MMMFVAVAEGCLGAGDEGDGGGTGAERKFVSKCKPAFAERRQQQQQHRLDGRAEGGEGATTMMTATTMTTSNSNSGHAVDKIEHAISWATQNPSCAANISILSTLA